MQKINHPINIYSNRLFLKTLGQENATKVYCSWLNDEEVNKYLETRHITIPELREYIYSKNINSSALLLGIFWKENNKHIGNIKLEPIDWETKKATMGIIVGDKDYWGKGIATEATKLIIEYAFNELKLEEINLGVISENKAAIRVYEKIGFIIDHVDEKILKHGDNLYDKVLMIYKKREKTT